MFWAIFSPIFSSFSTIFRKKSLGLSGQLSPFVVNFFGLTGYFVFIAYLFLSGKTDIFSTPSMVLLLTTIVGATWILTAYISEYVYKHEKISVIAPYENLNKVITIIASFFIFGNVSIISLFLGILVVVIVAIASIDFKKFELPKFIKLFTVHQIAVSSNYLIIGYILTQVSSIDYYILEVAFMMVLYFTLLTYRKEISQLGTGNKQFYQNRLLSSLLEAGAYFISLYIIASVGIIMNILISFLYLIFILIVSYLILGDKPERKSIFLSLVVSVIVGLAFYFNGG